MTSKEQIELALRAGLIAKCVLEMTAVRTKQMARIVWCETISQLRELDGFVDAIME